MKRIIINTPISFKLVLKSRKCVLFGLKNINKWQRPPILWPHCPWKWARCSYLGQRGYIEANISVFGAKIPMKGQKHDHTEVKSKHKRQRVLLFGRRVAKNGNVIYILEQNVVILGVKQSSLQCMGSPKHLQLPLQQLPHGMGATGAREGARVRREHLQWW